MDQNTLVAGGQALVKAMDAASFPPRIAMWVHNMDTDTWKLWLVPPKGHLDKQDFYRRIAQIVPQHRAEFGGIDASDTEMVSDTHPAMKGLSGFLKMPGLGSVQFSGNRFNGFYLPDGIILRSDL
ncbi:hypothetical protein [Methylocapsa sp. S129]|uniref:hypothetical protein n=1 Tax=Methylocapsa sp. S129 TaxID=1641869 RepID=UPI00131D0A0E|nr:hypothetical protein [Methylocapsa sp. S129]